MALTSGDILVYDGSQWNNQPSTSGSVDLPGTFSVDSPTFFVDPINHRVGIGTASPDADFEVATSDDWADTSSGTTRRLVYITPNAEPSANSASGFRAMNAQLRLQGTHNFTGACYGMLFFVSHQSSGSASNLFALGSNVEITGGGTAVNAYAGLFNVSIATVRGTITNAYAGNFRINSNVSGAYIASGRGVRVEEPVVASGAGIGTLYGVHIENQGKTGIANSVGLYVDNQSGATTTYAAILEGGNVGIGTTSPNFTVDVSGNVRIESNNKLYFGGTGSGDNDTDLYRSAADVLATDDDLALVTAGKGVRIAEGTNAKMGLATLSGGVVGVNTTAVKTNSRIMLTPQNQASGNVGNVYVSGRVDSTSFTIMSTHGSDDRGVAWVLFDPA